jgi:hypothetical protein
MPLKEKTNRNLLISFTVLPDGNGGFASCPELMTEEEVMALGLTRRVWCTTDRTHAGPGYAGSDQYGVERNTGKRYWLITKKKSTSRAVSSTSVPEPFEGAQAVEDPVPTIERPSIEERMMNRPQPSGSSKAD